MSRGTVGDEVIRLTNLYASLHNDDDQNSTFTFNDLILLSDSIYSEMNICAVNVSLNTIKLMDPELWEEVRLVYQKLKESEIVNTNDVNKMVFRILIQIYGTSKINDILETFSRDTDKAIFQFGKYLLSTYNEAYEIVSETEKELNKSVPSAEISKLTQSQFKDSTKITKTKNEARQQAILKGKSPLNTRRNCLACTAQTKIQSRDRHETLKTLQRKTDENKKDNIFQNENTVNEQVNNNLSSGDSLKCELSSQSQSVIVTERHEFRNLEITDCEEKINAVLSSEVQTEDTMATLLKQTNSKSAQKKTRSNFTISIDQAELKQDLENEQASVSSRLLLIPSAIWSNLNRPMVRLYARNMFLMVMFTYYKNNIVNLSGSLWMAAKWLKMEFRNLLLMMLSLLEN